MPAAGKGVRVWTAMVQEPLLSFCAVGHLQSALEAPLCQLHSDADMRQGCCAVKAAISGCDCWRQICCDEDCIQPRALASVPA